MKQKFIFFIMFAWVALCSLQAKNEPGLLVTTSSGSSLRASSADPDTLYIKGNGTDAGLKLSISGSNLAAETNIQIIPPAGFTASATSLPGNADKAEVIISLSATIPVSRGDLYLIAGSYVKKYYLIGYASALPEKDIAIDPIYPGGSDTEFELSDSEGFAPQSGFTIEFSVKLPTALSKIQPFAVKTDGTGFQGTISRSGFTIDNSTQAWLSKNVVDKNIQELGGTGVFLPDNKFHTYRFSVAPDKRIHIYRDGVLVDYARAQDYGLQSYMIDPDIEGDYEENMLVNGGFEGESATMSGSSILGDIEGWAIGAMDIWNSEQYLVNEEIDQTSPFGNRVFETNRYYWAEGWGAAEYSQFVDVIPGETYTLSALAKGGYSSHLKKYQGSLRIQEVHGTEMTNQKIVEVNSDDWQEYSMDYTPTASTKQIRVNIYLERGDTWGNGATMYVDNVKLTGKRAGYLQKTGFKSRAAEIEYFNFDATGAFAPIRKAIDVSASKLTINGESVSLIVTPVNIQDDIQLIAPAGFKVDKKIINARSGATEIKVSYIGSLEKNTGKLILTSDNIHAFVDLSGKRAPLPEKGLSSDPIYPGGNDTDFELSDAEGFTPENGYTIEISAKLPTVLSRIEPFGITYDGIGFQGHNEKSIVRINNSTQDWLSKDISNPASLNGTFYPDNNFHTYRYAVTKDKCLFVYRDGNLLDVLRTRDFGLQSYMIDPDVEGDYEENLLVNGNFEGESATMPGSSIVGNIEGWAIGAMDIWNSQQYIESQDAGNGDYMNHVLRTERYTWSEGWGAAEYSQFVDVIPGETYTLSALAKGGYSSHLKKYQGSLRIQEVHGTEMTNQKIVEVNSDDWQEYSMDYTPTATTKQIRVNIYLERGDTWGNGATMYVDNVKLTGKRAGYLQKTGFKARAAEIEYFNFDATGAYAPLYTGLVVEGTGINPVSGNNGITASVHSDLLFLYNVPAASQISIYNASGTFVKKVTDYSGTGIPLPQKGFYIAVIRNGNETKSVKVIN